MGTLTWYKRYPEAFLEGILDLRADEIGVYCVIIDMLYARDGDLADNDATIAFRLHLHLRRYRTIKTRLIKAGKVWIVDGKLHAKRVETTLKLAQNISKTQSKRAQKRWEKHEKQRELPKTHNDINDQAMPSPALPAAKPKELELEEEIETERDSESRLSTESLFDKSNLTSVRSREKISRANGHAPGKRARPRAPRALDEPEGFSTWYDEYPRHDARKAAAKAFPKALRTASYEQLLEGARRYARQVRTQGRIDENIALPASWLNGQRWCDQSLAVYDAAGPGRGSGVSERRKPKTPPPAH